MRKKMESINDAVEIYQEKSEVNDPETLRVRLSVVFVLNGCRVRVLENSVLN